MDKMKVLLVDDEEDFISTLAERLELRNMSPLVAIDGAVAIRLLEKHKPPVVVLDVMMPGIGGLDILKYIKRNCPNTQVIILTGRGTTKEGIESMRHGAFDYMLKPVKIEELLKKLNDAFEVVKKGNHSRPLRGI